jgi:hypothetical protein
MDWVVMTLCVRYGLLVSASSVEGDLHRVRHEASFTRGGIWYDV